MMRHTCKAVFRMLAAWALGTALLPAPQAAECRKLADECTEGPATRTIAGHAVTRDCWRTRARFECVSQALQDDCEPLRRQGCTQTGSVCRDTGEGGTCLLYEQAWQCPLAAAPAATVANCGGQRYCLDGKCFATGSGPDTGFGLAVAGLEIQREAGVYWDEHSATVFRGFAGTCRKALGGLLNCCRSGRSDLQAFTNLALLPASAAEAGSRYTHDALFAQDSPALVQAGLHPLLAAVPGNPALAGLASGGLPVQELTEALSPGTWAAARLATEAAGLLSCREDEQLLALKRERHLCHATGSYCSQRLPLLRTCTETTESFCCFNSRLARLLHEQGRAQLGRGWGRPEQPDCAGLTAADLQALDLSRMDLSEFYAEIVPALPDEPAARERAGRKLGEYFEP